MRNVRAALGKLAARNHSPERKRTASQEEANSPQLDSTSRAEDPKKLAETRADQPLLPRREPLGAVEAIIQSKAALADTDNGRHTNNEQFLDALEQVVAAPRDLGDEDAAAMLDDLRKQLETPAAEGRFVRFKAGDLARYQSSLRALGWADLSLKAGQLRLQRLNADFSQVRLDADASEWLATIEAGHAAELPAQCRIVGELQKFKLAVFAAAGTGEPPKCSWRDFIKVVSLIPGMKSEIQSLDRGFLQMLRVLEIGAAPSRDARAAQDLALKIAALQERAARSPIDGDVLTLPFNFGCTTRSSLRVSASGRDVNISVAGDLPTYRVVSDGGVVTAWLLNGTIDSPDAEYGHGIEDGVLEIPVNAWRPPA